MKIIDDQNLYRQIIPTEAPLYVQPAWMDVFSDDWKVKIGLNENGDPVWLWPYLEKSRYGMKRYGRLPFCPDNGPVFLDQGDVRLFDPGSQRWFSICVIDDRRNILDSEFCQSGSWKIEDRFYQYFDLQNYPDDFQEVSKSKRKRMKKNDHYTLIRYDDLNHVGSLFLASFHSMGQNSITIEVLERWKQDLEASFESFYFGLCDEKGNILSAQWLIGYKDTLYGWQAVRHPQFLDAGARELLLWHILQWARDHYLTYDLGGSSIPGVRQFNLEMGAKEVAYHRYVRYRPGIISNF